jgi:tRNA pseudouridine38-40 synthase
MKTFKITLAYDGTGFVGWQRQAAGVSVQGLLEDALRELDERDVAVAGAGRTDAGVHALGQVASFPLARVIAPHALVRALNARLPDQVRALSAVEVPAGFHARFGARTKMYRYRVWNAERLNPFERQYAWHVMGGLDVDQMDAAARLVEGRHDFAAFQASGGARRTTEREVYSSRVTGSGALVLYEISGNGFLRHMVRAIVGTLVEIGRGRRGADWMREVIASRDRSHAGPTAPAEGLFLVGVDYDAPAPDAVL